MNVRCDLNFAAVLFGVFLAPSVARADLQDWEVNEVVASVGGNPSIRFVELKNDVGGCLFPTSRLEVRDAEGATVVAIPLVTTTACFEAGWYLWVASPGAAAMYGLPADRVLSAPIDPVAGQVCFASSGTNYDCVRWGAVTTVITDFFGADDTTLAPAPADSVALARIATTHVVSADWALQTPTPRAPNDGTPWEPPDAGPIPDAGPVPDAGPIADAAPRPDGAPTPDAAAVPDARNDGYLDVTPAGGAACSCRAGGRGGRAPLGAGVLLLVAVGLRHGRRRPRDAAARVRPLRAHRPRAHARRHRR